MSDVALCPAAPHPRVSEGSRLVVPPTPPREDPALTIMRETGFLSPNSRTTRSSCE